MKHSKSEPSCDSTRLEVLLYGDEDSALFHASRAHVESCARCQDRLARLAADEKEWAEVRLVLGPDDADCGRSSCESNHRVGTQMDDTADRGKSGPSGGRLRLDFLSAPSHPELLGRLGRYDIEQVIGSGGMGVVLKGFDAELNRPVAIKVLAPHLAHSGAARRRFAREARAAAAVVHEHVVSIHNVEIEDEVPFLVMQYVRGRSLQERVDQEGPLEPAELLRVGVQAAAGLAAAHAQGVIHRDVKPANILLENGVERALLSDFGLARAAADASLTHSGFVAGTPHYMSPEQARGETTDERSDLFSLGSVLYFMATGHPPFRAEQAMAVLHRICSDRHRPVRQANPMIPDELSDLIDRLLEKKPSRRYLSARDVELTLSSVLSSIQQPRPSRRRWFRRLRRSRPRIAAVIGIGLVIAALGWLAGWYDFGRVASNNALEKTSSSESAARELQTQQAEFTGEIGAIDRSLLQLATRPYPETLVLRSNGDAWISNLGAVNEVVNRLETSWSVSPADSPSIQTSKGENR